mgnify:CR=1 FL=1
MTALRVLHVDDEVDIREVVEISLSLDPNLETRSCASGTEALAVTVDWPPDIIILDVMMPMMDGPTTLARLRENEQTAKIPVVFMTARAQSSEIDFFRSLGAAGVISKPFDPMTLAASVRAHARPAEDRLDTLRGGFLKRMAEDTAALTAQRAALGNEETAAQALMKIGEIAHALAGAGGIFGFPAVSDAASAVEIAVKLNGSGTPGDIAETLDRLQECLATSHALACAPHNQVTH